MKKIGFVSLGCPKNLVDSEVMLGLLQEQGYRITPDREEADIIVVNTCGFIDTAAQESVDTILEMAELKRSGRLQKLVVTGCLVERYRQELRREIPEVDAVLGTHEVGRILSVCENGARQARRQEANRAYLYDDRTPRLLTTPWYSAYIKIAEGCDHTCAFCIIPALRGKFRSRTIESIRGEAERLAAGGVREITLVAQDSPAFGKDHGLKDGLAMLLENLAGLRGPEWIRFLYTYPNTITQRLLDTVAAYPRLCKYVDLPLQHASGRILKRMGRGGTRRSLTALLDRIRKAVPGVTLRTSMIVGFPGEADEDFQELLRFCREIEFDRLGVFTYSDVETSLSYRLDGKVSEALKEERRAALLEQQAVISRKKHRQMVGNRFKALIEGPSSETDLLWQARLESQAPEIDGCVLVNDAAVHSARLTSTSSARLSSPKSVQAGQFRTVKITEAFEYDLVGTIVASGEEAGSLPTIVTTGRTSRPIPTSDDILEPKDSEPSLAQGQMLPV